MLSSVSGLEGDLVPFPTMGQNDKDNNDAI